MMKRVVGGLNRVIISTTGAILFDRSEDD